jgi:4-amino-4-deoxy-L-arabinose transferase-like glycosyltransferase
MNHFRFFSAPWWVRALPFAAVYGVYAAGLSLDVMDVDSAQYAEMSREMLETGSFLQIFERGRDYLDKPPLIFWLTALSYWLFGVSEWAFRLPSVLFSMLGNYAAFGLGRRLYGYETGYLTALMAAGCQAFFLFNHDVRTDTLLTGSVIVAIWQINEFLHTGRMRHVLLGFTAVAAAMLAKGPIGLMVPVLAFSTDFLLKRQWRNLLRWQWLAGAAWVAVLLLPMCVGLYQQFDLHPEKTMYGRTGTSGLRFYFWTQSFGRITGESTWNNRNDLTFFMHTFLWSFLPWSLFFVAALFLKMKALVKFRFRLPATDEALTLGGFVLPFIAFTSSRYHLPHYIFVLFPLAAVLSATYVVRVLLAKPPSPALAHKAGPKTLVFVLPQGEGGKSWRWVQLFVGLVVWAAGVLLATVVFPLHSPLVWVLVGASAITAAWLFLTKGRLGQLVWFPLASIVAVNIIMNLHFYPELFKFQSGSIAGRFLRQQKVNTYYCYRDHPHSLDFAARQVAVDIVDVPSFLRAAAAAPRWVFTDQAGFDELKKNGAVMLNYREMTDFNVSMLSLLFLNPNTRHTEVSKRYLVSVQ